jgi:hypothetical protein
MILLRSLMVKMSAVHVVVDDITTALGGLSTALERWLMLTSGGGGPGDLATLIRR